MGGKPARTQTNSPLQWVSPCSPAALA